MLTVKDPNGNITSYEYGGVNGGDDAETGLVTSILHAGHTQREIFFYDIMGVIEHRTPMGAVTRTGYDALGRVTQRTFPTVDGGLTPAVTYAYDANGSVTKTVGPRASEITANKYDAQNRLIKTTNPMNGVTTRQYADEEGNLLQETRPNGVWSIFTYDDRAVAYRSSTMPRRTQHSLSQIPPTPTAMSSPRRCRIPKRRPGCHHASVRRAQQPYPHHVPGRQRRRDDL